MLFFQLSILYYLIASTSATRLIKHDESFTPDIVLRVGLTTILQSCEPRLSVVVNGTYPGPPIYLETDVTTWVRVYNDADVNTTMHWHGLTQSTSPFADGTPLASQWPIPPGHFFDYELHPDNSEAGTYFYHTHVGFQAITANGVLIVKDPVAPPYQYDDEIILHIGDFYPKDDYELETMLTSSPHRWTGDPAALLINGQSGIAPTVENMTPDKSCQPHIIDVQPGTTYRLRVIGATAISMVTFAIDQHTSLDIIAADSYYTQKYTTDHIQVQTGQRFDALLTTKSQAELDKMGNNQFWVQFETREAGSVQRAYAILNYQTTTARGPPKARRDQATYTWAPVQAPSSVSPVPVPTQIDVDQQIPSNATLKYDDIAYIPINPPLEVPYSPDWLEYALVNLQLPCYLEPIDSSEVTRRIVVGWTQLASKNQSGRTVYLGSLPGQDPAAGEGYSWFDAQPSGPSYSTPYLIDIYRHGQAGAPDYERAMANGGIDPVLQAWPARIGEVLEIVWQNEASDTGKYGIHPLHAHGGPYFDIGSGSGIYDPEANDAKLAEAGWKGTLRDTTILPAPAPGGRPYSVNGWRAWRVRITEANIGVWSIHCHILQHVIMGQQTIWVFGNADDITKGSNGAQSELQGYFTYGGNVVGSEGQGKRGLEKKWPTVAHFFEPTGPRHRI
ncbi:hypothetical protein LTR05_007648 [Lithohypha guttulata]|uniref:L-ascorbate oxidase n=1 Tax=Lithohypha guttulata TaxID=1690604 RepID=A0AAN7SV46_9EURO|nr:hypothetical protein LTR05_007648 [Lithohypha guttulata]